MPTAKNQVRIIGGEWRSRLINFESRADLRPTPDRVRETLFNWLGQDLTGKSCLDLFAGSGALGFEAASRGAQRVVMIESDPVAWRALQDNVARLKARSIELKRADALEFLRADDGCYDVVFLDPPFRANYLEQVLPLLNRHLKSASLVHVEAPAAPDLPPGWQIWRDGRAGAVTHQLLKWTCHDA
ncbi:MAG: rsmD [Betaproteobacteria bacterium]|nr:rsmD [Betaproteobacteria bacterium]